MNDRLAKIHGFDSLPRAAAIEIPANVKTQEKAVSMVGGSQKIAASIADSTHPLELRYRPEDVFEHPIAGRSPANDNILLKITVSREVYDQAGGDIQKAVKLSQGKYKVRPSHVLSTNFRFRELSDFQWNTANSQFVQKMAKSIYAADYDEIKKLELEGPVPIETEQMDAIPPPKFASINYPYFQYQFRQNPALTAVDDGEGGKKLINTAAAEKVATITLRGDIKQVPMEPLQKTMPRRQEAVAAVEELRALFERRPIWSRRAIRHELSATSTRNLRVALPHVAFTLTSGPFRGSYVKIAVDPRQSSEYAKYQSEHFRVFDWIEESLMKKKKRTMSQLCKAAINKQCPYEFDGVDMPDSKMVLLCDITDPLIQKYVDEANLNSRFDPEHGWFARKDVKIIKGLLKARIKSLKRGTLLQESEVTRIVEKSMREDEDEEGSEDEDEDYIRAMQEELDEDEEFAPNPDDKDDDAGGPSSEEDDDVDEDAKIMRRMKKQQQLGVMPESI